MKTTKEMIEVMEAYTKGKEIEHKCDDDWYSIREPRWDWIDYDYRVKEEPKYRPYKDIAEMINDFCERSGARHSAMYQLHIWVRRKVDKVEKLITGHNKDSNELYILCWVDLITLFDNYTYLDGSPCGIKE